MAGPRSKGGFWLHNSKGKRTLVNQAMRGQIPSGETDAEIADQVNNLREQMNAAAKAKRAAEVASRTIKETPVRKGKDKSGRNQDFAATRQADLEGTSFKPGSNSKLDGKYKQIQENLSEIKNNGKSGEKTLNSLQIERLKGTTDKLITEFRQDAKASKSTPDTQEKGGGLTLVRKPSANQESKQETPPKQEKKVKQESKQEPSKAPSTKNLLDELKRKSMEFQDLTNGGITKTRKFAAEMNKKYGPQNKKERQDEVRIIIGAGGVVSPKKVRAAQFSPEERKKVNGILNQRKEKIKEVRQEIESLKGMTKNKIAEDIKGMKKEFRKTALKHHPDHGGDHEKFMEMKDKHELKVKVAKFMMDTLDKETKRQRTRGQ